LHFTFRISTNTLGNGFIECVANEAILAIRDAQPAEIRGTAVMAPVLEGGNAMRVGRFGWKNQHASLESFSADAYLNEMGITNPLFPDENTSAGRNVGFGTPFDPVPDPEDDGVDVVAFANFMRSTKAPSRGRITRDVQAGEQLFNQVGCNGCHVATLRTVRAGMDCRSRNRKRSSATATRPRACAIATTRSRTSSAIWCSRSSNPSKPFPGRLPRRAVAFLIAPWPSPFSTTTTTSDRHSPTCAAGRNR
jgi:CxxC motif-containing protein (DUF1111 family)